MLVLEASVFIRERILTLQSFTGFRGSSAEWRQPRALEMDFVLWNKTSKLARLYYRSCMDQAAIAITKEARWSIERVGFLNPRVVVRYEGVDEALAIYQPKFWGDGELEVINGPTISWKPSNFRNTEWAFIDPNGIDLLRYQEGLQNETWNDMFKCHHTMTLGYLGTYRRILPLLSCLGMYLIEKRQRVVGAGVTVMAAATAG